MKLLLILRILCFACVGFLSCKSHSTPTTPAIDAVAPTSEQISTNVSAESKKEYPMWITEFKRLRDALYQNNMEELQSFFDFPLTDDQSTGLFNAGQFMSGREVNIVTKEEFIKSYTALFPQDFIKGLLPLKSDSLLLNQYAASPEWKRKGDNAVYTTSASFEEHDQILSLYLNATYFIEDSEETSGESAVVFMFKMKNGKLTFEGVMMAG
ncbi:MAG: hypothetical protein K1X55_05435 [Chitinophagales bacterium]|nr:hypothetical protein [Chitinophagales bacterium]